MANNKKKINKKAETAYKQVKMFVIWTKRYLLKLFF